MALVVGSRSASTHTQSSRAKLKKRYSIGLEVCGIWRARNDLSPDDGEDTKVLEMEEVRSELR